MLPSLHILSVFRNVLYSCLVLLLLCSSLEGTPRREGVSGGNCGTMSDDIAPHFPGGDCAGPLARGGLAMGVRQVGSGQLQVRMNVSAFRFTIYVGRFGSTRLVDLVGLVG